MFSFCRNKCVTKDTDGLLYFERSQFSVIIDSGCHFQHLQLYINAKLAAALEPQQELAIWEIYQPNSCKR